MPGDGPDEDDSTSEPVDIDPSGDVVVVVSHLSHQPVAFRISATQLRSSSRYFAQLFEPSKFSEGHQVEQTLALLRKQYEHVGMVPASQLPKIYIEYLGRVGKLSSIEGLMSDFFSILHGKKTSTRAMHMPLMNLANLAVVADRLDALEPLRQHAARLKLPEIIDARARQPAVFAEERARMKVYVGYLLGHHPWVKESHGIIVAGSNLWLDHDQSRVEGAWWDLPGGLEGGISFSIVLTGF